MDGSDGIREDTTMLVQIEDGKSAIRVLSFVTKLSPVGVHNGHGAGWGASLTCYSCCSHVCVGEELDPSRVDQISWCQDVHVLNRPLGQKTSSQSQYRNHENRVTEIVVKDLKRDKP